MNKYEIMRAVKEHHEYVAKMPEMSIYAQPVMTVLIGSQNYGLDTEKSDIDTFTFVIPSLFSLAINKKEFRGEFEVKDGKCMYKDIREALNLLKKTSPNSLECFTSHYIYYNPKYEATLRAYFDNPLTVYYMTHCNYSHMLYSICGMAHQLEKRNMPGGKRYSHALRLVEMTNKFLQSNPYIDMLSLDTDRDLALNAKLDKEDKESYNDICQMIALSLDTIKDNFNISEEQKLDEYKGMCYIEQLQVDMMYKLAYE